MSFFSDVKNAARKAYDRAEHAAEASTEKVKEAAAAGTEKVKEAAGRAKEPPPPSKAVDDHAAQAAAAAARNAPPVAANTTGAAKKSEAANPAVFGGVGFGTGAGTGPCSLYPTAVFGAHATGGEASVGKIVPRDGETRSYKSTGTARQADGVGAGLGGEVGVVRDADAFFGDGTHYQVSWGPVSMNVQTTPEGNINAVSIGAGKSQGGGWFDYATKTEDTTGR